SIPPIRPSGPGSCDGDGLPLRGVGKRLSMPGEGKMLARAGADASLSLAAGGEFLAAADRAEPLAVAVRGGTSWVAAGGETSLGADGGEPPAIAVRGGTSSVAAGGEMFLGADGGEPLSARQGAAPIGFRRSAQWHSSDGSAASVLAAAPALLQLRQHLVEREAARLLPGRVLDVGLQMLAHDVLRRNEYKGALDAPLVIFSGLELGSLERISAQIHQLGEPKWNERVLPYIETFRALLQEQYFPAVIAQSSQIAIIGPVEIFFALAWTSACQQTALIVAIKVDLEGLWSSLIAGEQFLRDIRLACRRDQRRHPIFM